MGQLFSRQIALSPAGYGTWQFGSKGADDYWGFTCDQELANALVLKAAQCGVKYFDTAEDYAKGVSEEQLGAAIRALPADLRAGVVIGSKLLPNHAAEVEKYTDATLGRLGVSCIDLYMVHWPIDANSMAHFAGGHETAAGGRDYSQSDAGAVGTVPPTVACFRELARLQRAGKIRHVGVSNFGVSQLKEALDSGVTLAVNQLCYSLVFRAIEAEILPFCAARGIQVICYSPLMQGLLTDRWASADEVPTYRARSRHFDGARERSRHGEGGHEALLFATLARVRAIADEVGVPMGDLALQWPLANPAVATVIVGATKPEQIAQNCAAIAKPMAPELKARLDDATEELRVAMGPNADLWQGGDNGRIK